VTDPDALAVTITVGQLRELVRDAVREELAERAALATEAPPLITTAEAAKLLRMPVRTVSNLCKEGKLPAEMVGGQWRIRRDLLLRGLRGSDAA